MHTKSELLSLFLQLLKDPSWLLFYSHVSFHRKIEVTTYSLWLTHPLFWEGLRTQKGAKCARKHKNNNKIPVYFDNIILNVYKSRHVTSNQFRYRTDFEKGSKF